MRQGHSHTHHCLFTCGLIDKREGGDKDLEVDGYGYGGIVVWAHRPTPSVLSTHMPTPIHLQLHAYLPQAGGARLAIRPPL